VLECQILCNLPSVFYYSFPCFLKQMIPNINPLGIYLQKVIFSIFMISQYFSLFSTFGNEVHWKKEFTKDKSNFLTWGLFALFVLFAFRYLSDGDFSFVLVCSSISYLTSVDSQFNCWNLWFHTCLIQGSPLSFCRRFVLYCRFPYRIIFKVFSVVCRCLYFSFHSCSFL
jgi:hypothetical protein